MIYLDYSATSAVKPPSVYDAMRHFLEKVGASPGRSAHQLAVESGRIVFNCREALAQLLGAPDSDCIVFALNATHALNVAFLGLLRRGDRVVTSSMEHNSVMRPLRNMQAKGTIELEMLPCDPDGLLDIAVLEKALATKTRMVALTHASNVVGTVLPAAEAARAAHAAGALFLLDAAQTAGAYPIDISEMDLDIMVCSGHKGLLGPHGTGVLYVREGVEVEAVFQGGTGSMSEKTRQPDFMPDRLECGTLNAVGIAGLGAGVEFIRGETVEKIRKHELRLTERMLEGLGAVEGVTIYGTRDARRQTATVAFNINGREPSDVGNSLDREFEIAVRVGLHCAPVAHETMGTFPRGTVRASAGYLSTEKDIDALIDAVGKIASR